MQCTDKVVGHGLTEKAGMLHKAVQNAHHELTNRINKKIQLLKQRSKIDEMSKVNEKELIDNTAILNEHINKAFQKCVRLFTLNPFLNIESEIEYLNVIYKQNVALSARLISFKDYVEERASTKLSVVSQMLIIKTLMKFDIDVAFQYINEIINAELNVLESTITPFSISQLKCEGENSSEANIRRSENKVASSSLTHNNIIHFLPALYLYIECCIKINEECTLLEKRKSVLIKCFGSYEYVKVAALIQQYKNEMQAKEARNLQTLSCVTFTSHLMSPRDNDVCIAKRSVNDEIDQHGDNTFIMAKLRWVFMTITKFIQKSPHVFSSYSKYIMRAGGTCILLLLLRLMWKKKLLTLTFWRGSSTNSNLRSMIQPTRSNHRRLTL